MIMIIGSNDLRSSCRALLLQAHMMKNAVKNTELNVTANGTYTAGEGDYAGFTGFNPVNVNVPISDVIFEDIVNNGIVYKTYKLTNSFTLKFVVRTNYNYLAVPCGIYGSSFQSNTTCEEYDEDKEKWVKGYCMASEYYSPWIRVEMYAVLYYNDTPLIAQLEGSVNNDCIYYGSFGMVGSQAELPKKSPQYTWYNYPRYELVNLGLADPPEDADTPIYIGDLTTNKPTYPTTDFGTVGCSVKINAIYNYVKTLTWDNVTIDGNTYSDDTKLPKFEISQTTYTTTLASTSFHIGFFLLYSFRTSTWDAAVAPYTKQSIKQLLEYSGIYLNEMCEEHGDSDLLYKNVKPQVANPFA